MAATAMLDEEHDPLTLPTDDENSYTYGSINGHNVVIACMPPGQPGKVSASRLVQPLRQSFPNLKIHLFVGIGSGVPRIPPPDDSDDDIHLGDVVIGWAEQTGVPGVIQWDLVRYLEDGTTEPLGILDKPDRRLLSVLGLLLRNRIFERTRFPEHLKRLQKFTGFSHPGFEHDKLFKPTYHHVGGPNCSSCSLVQIAERPPRVNQDLVFHQGTIVSGDAVMKDPQRRDKISQIYYGALCFEMEAAGVMDDKRCLIIRGIANYADSHKNDLWQNYAAGTAAAFAREFLCTAQPQDVNKMEPASEILLSSCMWIVVPQAQLKAYSNCLILANTVHSNNTAASTTKVHFVVPFQRNGDLIGRTTYIQSLETKLCVPNKVCRVALVGLGGIGYVTCSRSFVMIILHTTISFVLILIRKTRIALEYVSKHEKSDSLSVFWVHASTADRMEKAYQEIAKEARLFGAEDPKVDQFQLVKHWLEGNDSGNWVMVIDNADDEKLFFGDDEDEAGGQSSLSNNLARYFPQRPNGSILLTTRNKKLGIKFASVRGVITIPKMSMSESKSLLLKALEDDNQDENELTELAKDLENLPLALVQAASFIGKNSQPIGEYLRMYRGSDSAKMKLLSQNFEDVERDPESKNPVAVTWAISFEQIKRNDHRAAELLSLMSVLDRQAIPKSLLSSNIEEVELEIALGTLKAYSLITAEKSGQALNLHRLVYLATRNWLEMDKKLVYWTESALVLLAGVFPYPKFENREITMLLLPHAHAVLNSDHLPASEDIALATLLRKVSRALDNKGDYDPAEVMAQKSLELREKALGKKHTHTLYSLNTLGGIFLRKGKNSKAEEVFRQALNGLQETLGRDDPNTLHSLYNLAIALKNQGHYEEAERLNRQELSATEKILGPEHPATLLSLENLASVLKKKGQ